MMTMTRCLLIAASLLFGTDPLAQADEPKKEKAKETASAMQERARIFRDHLIAMTDADGLVLGEVNVRGPRPFTNEDFRGRETWDHAGDDVAGFIGYVDCIMTTARFIHAEVLRHLATKGRAGLERAERCARSILAVSAAGDRHERGYLPEPIGGLAKAALGRDISTDQYEHALFALWSLRHATADASLRRQIDEAIVGWAEYFLRHDFTFVYYGRATVTPENGLCTLLASIFRCA